MATLYHIPICPFSQRIEILLELAGQRGALDFEVVDVTRPRPPKVLRKSRGKTAFPILDLDPHLERGRVIRESLVILRYVLDTLEIPGMVRADPWERAVEGMLIAEEGPFTRAGYLFVLNSDPERREAFEASMLERYAELDAFLSHFSPGGPYLFEDFGLAEVVFTPMFRRFAFLGYYEGFELPEEPAYARVRAWRDACLSHPCAQQVSDEEVNKLYYDYAQGVGNGGLLPGRTRSSFTPESDWRERPWPPKGKYGAQATDAELGLL